MTSEPRFLTAGVLSSTSGQVDIDLKTGSIAIKGPAGGAVVGSLDSGDVVARIAGAQEVGSLDLGGVTLYGDFAVKVRELQGILATHGAGELKLVKPKTEDGTGHIVIDGQVFINEALLAQAKLRTATTEQGNHVAAGLGLGLEMESTDELLNALAATIDSHKFEVIDPADRVRQVIREELRPGGLLHRR